MSRWISLPRAAWGAVIAAALLGACSAPTLAELGSFTCAAEYQCPQGFTCNRDTKKCSVATEPGSPDASDATVGPSDASDAAPEADATVDAADASDASVDSADARDATDATADATNATDALVTDAADAKGPDASDGGPPDTGAQGVIQMVSLTEDGGQGDQPILGSPSITENGYGVAFASASAHIQQDSNGVADVFVRSSWGGTTGGLLVSKDNSPPTLWTNASTQPVLSSDGNYVMFHTLASGVGVQPGCILRDANFGSTTWQLSTSPACVPYAVSSDGRYALFSEPVSGVTTLKRFDRTSSSSITITNLGNPTSASMTRDGGSVAFLSTHAFQLNDTNGRTDLYTVYVSNNTPTTYQLVSTTSNGDPLPNGATAGGVSGNHGTYWLTTVDRVVTGDTDTDADVYVMAGPGAAFLTLASGTASGAAGLGAISDDARYLAFEFTPQGGNKEIWVYDSVNKTTTTAHKTHNGGTPNGPAERPAISGDGKWIAFVSPASNLVAVDTNGQSDVFLLPRP